MQAIRVAILTVSDGVAAGHRTDTSGALIAAWASRPDHVLVAHDVVSDDAGAITAALMRLVDDVYADLVITTGGTGFTARDVTPEATRAVIERDVPGIAEAIRARGTASTPYAVLSRGLAGLRGSTLLVNLPGSNSGVRDGLVVLEQVAHHAVQLLRGIDTRNHLGDG